MVGPGTFLSALLKRVARVDVQQLENLAALDTPGPALILVNHTTVVDVVVVVGTLHRLGYTVDGPCKGKCTHKRHIRPVGTSDMWDYPIARQICTGSGIIPTDQHDGRAAYRAARAALANKEVVLIYPEGDVKINDDASPRDWRPGAVALARASGAVIVPIAQDDSRKLGYGSVKDSIVSALMKVFRRVDVALRIGEPIDGKQLQSMTADEATHFLKSAFEENWKQLRASQTS